MDYTTLWTKLGGTKFVGFMALAAWAVWMTYNGIKADPAVLEFVKYIWWGFIFGNVGAMGAQSYAATKSAASNGTAPAPVTVNVTPNQQPAPTQGASQ